MAAFHGPLGYRHLHADFASGILGLMLFARIWGGLVSGGLTVAAPLYLSEIAPARSRGIIMSMYMVMLLVFLTVGFFINYGVNAHMAISSAQYRLSSDVNDRSLSHEYREIQEQIRAKAHLGEASTITIIKEIASSSSYRKRFILGALMQTVAQWSGGNRITYYIPEIFEYAGVTGSNISLITSGAYGIVKLVFTMVFTWGLVDIIGRRRCMLTGIGLQCITHIYMAIYMSLFKAGTNKSASDAAIASVFIYAVGWSIGLCTVQYLYGTEIYPTRIRSVCYATNMALDWFFQFAIVRVMPNMFVSLDVYGAYVFWTVVCAVGGGLWGVMALETTGVPMERMEELFSRRWWMGWRAGVDLASTSRGGVGKAGVAEVERV